MVVFLKILVFCNLRVNLKKEFETFINDLKDFGCDAFREGIVWMDAHLTKILPTKAEQFDELFSDLYRHNPELIQGIRDRLKTFHAMRSK